MEKTRRVRVVLTLTASQDLDLDQIEEYVEKAVDGWSGQFDALDPLRSIEGVSVERIGRANAPRKAGS